MNEIQHIEQKVAPVTDYAMRIVISSTEAVEEGKTHIQAIKELTKEISLTFDPIIKKAYEAHKEAVGAKKKHIAPLESAEKMIKGKIAGYLDDLARKAEEEEKKLRASAEKEKAKAINSANRRIAALLEQSGDLAQQIAILENERNNPEITVEENDAITHRLSLLSGKQATVEAKIEDKKADIVEAQFTAPLSSAPAIPKVEGMSSRVKLVVTVVNPMAIVKAVAEGKLPVNVIDFNIKSLTKLAEAGLHLPGCSMETERIVSVRS